MNSEMLKPSVDWNNELLNSTLWVLKAFGASAVCVLIARQPDRWLAHWSRAEATLALPVDPLVAPGVVADLLRDRVRRPVVRR